jgi:hypothetical protein
VIPHDDKAQGKLFEPAKPTGLPLGWIAVLDRQQNKYFYYNQVTHERTWFRPSGRTETIVQNEELEVAYGFEFAPTKNKPKGKKHDIVQNLWDAKPWCERMARFRTPPINANGISNLLTEVKGANDDHVAVRNFRIPKTVLVTYDSVKEALMKRQLDVCPHTCSVTISQRTTADAIEFFAQDPDRVVCAVNFASGRREKIGGEYANEHDTQMTDNDNQEEDLCRRVGVLYPSLAQSAETCYPFGPCTVPDHVNPSEIPERYRDVLFTPFRERDGTGEVQCTQITRGNESAGFPVLADADFRRCCIVSAAAPITKDTSKVKDQLDYNRIYETVTSMFVAPKMHEPKVTTLVLGAWGCGSRCGLKPQQMAKMYSEVITRNLPPPIDTCLGKLYHEVHFAIPVSMAAIEEGDDKLEEFETTNYSIFKKELEAQGVVVYTI